MNLFNDNYKYLKNDWQDQEGAGKKAKQRRLIALFKDSFYSIYIDLSDIKDYNKNHKYFKDVILPDLYKNYKKKNLSTRSLIKELLKSRDKSNIIIANEILKQNL